MKIRLRWRWPLHCRTEIFGDLHQLAAVTAYQNFYNKLWTLEACLGPIALTVMYVGKGRPQ